MDGNCPGSGWYVICGIDSRIPLKNFRIRICSPVMVEYFIPNNLLVQNSQSGACCDPTWTCWGIQLVQGMVWFQYKYLYQFSSLWMIWHLMKNNLFCIWVPEHHRYWHSGCCPSIFDAGQVCIVAIWVLPVVSVTISENNHDLKPNPGEYAVWDYHLGWMNLLSVQPVCLNIMPYSPAKDKFSCSNTMSISWNLPLPAITV